MVSEKSRKSRVKVKQKYEHSNTDSSLIFILQFLETRCIQTNKDVYTGQKEKVERNPLKKFCKIKKCLIKGLVFVTEVANYSFQRRKTNCYQTWFREHEHEPFGVASAVAKLGNNFYFS